MTVSYRINFLFVALLYVWSITITMPCNTSVLASAYLLTFLLIFIPLYSSKKKASAYVLLLTYIYAILSINIFNVNYSTLFAEAILSALGVIFGIMLLYCSKISRIGIYLITLYATINAVIDAYTFNAIGYSPDIGTYDLFLILLLNPLFLTAFVTTYGAITKRRIIRTSSHSTKQKLPAVQNYQYLQYIPLTIVKVRGLPSNCSPTLRIDKDKYFPDTYYKGEFIFEVPADSIVRLGDIICQGVRYKPNVTSIKVTGGKDTIIEYTPVVPIKSKQTRPQVKSKQTNPQAPSIVLMRRNLSNWSPDVWVNRKLSVYTIEKVIGEGGNGYVLKGNYSGKPVAIKVLKLYGGTPEEYFSDLTTEASNLINLSNHKNIVKVYAINVDSFVIDEILKGKLDLYATNPPMIVMEFMEGGTLKDLLDNDVFYYSSKWQRTILRAICETAQALDYIHSQGFVHMDIKPQNIFLTKNPNDPAELDNVSFKLGDLGSAVRVNGKVKQITPEYSPPDVFQGLAMPHHDIFALGMTAYVLLTRKIDRPDLSEMNKAIDCYVKNDMTCVNNEVYKAKINLINWKFSIDPKIDPLIKSMISVDLNRRPTAKDVISMIKRIHPTLC